MSPYDENITAEETRQLDGFAQTIDWLTSEHDRACEAIAKGKAIKKNAERLFEIQDRCRSLGREVERYLERFE